MRDQVDRQGNFGVVTRYLLTGEVDERFPPEPSRSSPSLSVAQVGTRFVAMASLTEQGTARWGGAAVVEGMAHPPPRSSLLVMSILLLAIGFGAMPSSRRPLGRVVIDPFAVWLCRASLGAFAIELVAALSARGEFRYYLIAGVSGVGLAAWLAAGLVALAVFRATSASRRVDASPYLRLGASALVLALVVALAQTKPMNDYFGFRAHIDHDDPTILAVMDAVPAGDILLVADRLSTLSTTNQVALSLQHHGRSVNVDGRFIAHFADRNRQSKRGVLVRLIAVDVDAPEACEIQGLYNGFKVCVQG